MTGDIVLDVRDLQTHFFLRRGIVKAVDGVSFSLRRGEVLGLVGESGCGKSLTALSLMRLLPKGGARTIHGEVLLNGDDILTRTPREMREIRGRKISMVLQDPQTSLNPVFTIGDQLREAIFRRSRARHRDLTHEAIEALRRVDISAPEQRIGQFPHQMSGGMKQRVVGAISISGHPEVLIADEPTTALDVTIQLQYLKLLQRLQQPGLSDSRLAGEPYYLTFAVLRQIPAVEQQVEFLSPSDQGCGLRSVQCLEPALARLLTQNLMGAHGGVEALGANRWPADSRNRRAHRRPGISRRNHRIG